MSRLKSYECNKEDKTEKHGRTEFINVTSNINLLSHFLIIFSDITSLSSN